MRLPVIDENQPILDLKPSCAPQNHFRIIFFKKGGLRKTMANIKFFIFYNYGLDRIDKIDKIDWISYFLSLGMKLRKYNPL